MGLILVGRGISDTSTANRLDTRARGDLGSKSSMIGMKYEPGTVCPACKRLIRSWIHPASGKVRDSRIELRLGVSWHDFRLSGAHCIRQYSGAYVEGSSAVLRTSARNGPFVCLRLASWVVGPAVPMFGRSTVLAFSVRGQGGVRYLCRVLVLSRPRRWKGNISKSIKKC